MLRETEAAGWVLLTRPASKGCCVEQEVRDVQGAGQGGESTQVGAGKTEEESSGDGTEPAS